MMLTSYESLKTSSSASSANNRLLAALSYASMGWSVLPLYGVIETAQGFACRCKAGSKCKSPGKHPLARNGLDDASAEPEVIRDWFSAWPDANIGVACGNSGFVAVDVDPRNGGDMTLQELLDEHGELPSTIVQLTGGDGLHYLFHQEVAASLPGKLGAGIDLKSNGYIVVEPSQHVSGRTYQWADGKMPDPSEIAALPAWMLSTLRTRRVRPADTASPGTPILEGERNETMFSICIGMSRSGLGLSEMLSAAQAINDQRCSTPLDDDELCQIVRSASIYAAKQEKTSRARKGSVASVASVAPGTKTWPAPLDEAALHGLAGDIVRTIDPQTEADPASILIQFLVCFGSAVGASPHFRAEADKHRANLFSVLVGETSKARKGASMGQVRRLFTIADEEWEADRVQSGLSSGEGLIHAVRDPQYKPQPIREKGKTVDYEQVLVDAGVDDKRLLVIEPEFASLLRVLRREGNTLSAQVRQAWDSGTLRVLTRNNPLTATGSHVSIVGHVTSQELLAELSTTEAANGFANRFLFFCVKRSKLLPEGGYLPESEIARLAEAIREATDWAKGCGEVVRDEDARKAWVRVYPELSRGGSGLCAAVTARSEPQTMRLALLYALLDRSSVIRREHLEAGLAVWEYAQASARFVFGSSVGDSIADKILSALRESAQGLSRTQIRDLFNRHKGAAEIEQALAVLANNNLATCATESNNGRTTERWFAKGQ